VLQAVTEDDVSAEALPFRRAKTISIGGAQVLAQRITYVGELGFELYVDRDWAVQVWDRLMAAGADHGIAPGGYRVLDSLRLEKGYRYFGTDLTAGDNPLEAGLDFCIDWDKDFTGRAALEERTPERRLRTLLVGNEHYATVYGGEAIHADGGVVGRVRSAGYGFTVGRNVALGYVPMGFEEGTKVGIEVFGEIVPAEIARDVLYDPENARVRG
jgi:glycine cleavage system aminomethyltransferase T